MTAKQQTKSRRLRELLARPGHIVSAGAYDALSARIIEACGFDLIYTTGFGISASRLGLPDAELYTMTENLETVREIVNVVSIPVIADIDTGYGNAINVQRTVRAFEKAGCAGVVLEDQLVPKRCPACVDTVEVVSRAEAVGKLQAALEMREDPDFLVVARTDTSGKEQLARAQAFAQAGADLVNPISRSFSGIAELRAFAVQSPVPLLVNALSWLEGELRPDLISQLNTKIVNFALLPLQVAAQSMMTSLQQLRTGGSAAAVAHPRMPIEQFKQLLGFPELEKQQQKFLMKTWR